jgi:hypothetical protein
MANDVVAKSSDDDTDLVGAAIFRATSAGGIDRNDDAFKLSELVCCSSLSHLRFICASRHAKEQSRITIVPPINISHSSTSIPF